MSRYQKLELTWIGKDEELNLEPRILIEDKSKAYGEKDTENMLIKGDNLLALKALEAEFTGKVKCIYIDPPYNTGNAFEHYDDGLEHSLWLNLMKHRLVILRNLLSEDGSIWISIDDDESHYLKVLCDEIFGRVNFVANVIWEKKFSPQNDAKWLSDSHDHILVYAKNKEVFRPNLLPRTEEMDKRYKNPDNDPRGPWTSGDLSVKTYSKTTDYEIKTPSGRNLNPPESRCWSVNKEKLQELIKDSRIWFGKDGAGVPRIKRFLSEVQSGSVSKTIWQRDEVGDNQDAKREVKAFNDTEVFATPKPERLIERILTLASNPGDLILDSFLGSGTTAAVANKMGRRWIGIELGEHCDTHCVPRLQKVIDGTDQGGISKAMSWTGGGGFKYYHLAPSLLQQDEKENWLINADYDENMLAEAMAKHQGFTYKPKLESFWKQGFSTENDYIYTTDKLISLKLLEEIHSSMRAGETLLICCKAFEAKCKDAFSNIIIKKIPASVLKKCEFGKEDYSLKITETNSEEEPSLT
ncbi:MAG: site-specific DNA-methyltransferase [Proteobacteria bacterium]|nr:site-specific DNA-methyltransferase [Pseudomonadota bacterium]